MRRTSLAGVLYAEDFDEPAFAAGSDDAARESASIPAPSAPPEPPPIRLEPTFSLGELQRAVEQAVEEGRTLERSRNAEDDARHRAEALRRLDDAFREAEALAVAERAALADALATAMMAAVAALLPELSARHGARELELVVRRLLPTLAGERRLVIRARPDTLEMLREDVAPRLDEHGIAGEWRPDASMGPADLSVRWEHGGLLRNADALAREIATLIMPSPDAGATGTETCHGQ